MKSTLTKRMALALIGAATIFGASACGTSGGGSSTAPEAPTSTQASMEGMGGSPMASPSGTTMAGHQSSGTTSSLTIHIKSFAYTGPDNVPAGASVTVMNMDNEAHTVTADDGSFDAVVKPGTSTTFTAPAKAGSYPYHCTYHSGMQGTLTVK